MTSLGDRLVKKGCRNLGGTAQFTSNSIQGYGWVEAWGIGEGVKEQGHKPIPHLKKKPYTLKGLFEAIGMTSHNRTELLKVR